MYAVASVEHILQRCKLTAIRSALCGCSSVLVETKTLLLLQRVVCTSTALLLLLFSLDLCSVRVRAQLLAAYACHNVHEPPVVLHALLSAAAGVLLLLLLVNLFSHSTRMHVAVCAVLLISLQSCCTVWHASQCSLQTQSFKLYCLPPCFASRKKTLWSIVLAENHCTAAALLLLGD
jgi:hypothetical protein